MHRWNQRDRADELERKAGQSGTVAGDILVYLASRLDLQTSCNGGGGGRRSVASLRVRANIE